MADSSLREFVDDILTSVDVQVNGDRPWDLQVHDKRFYRRILGDGSLGLGESYMEGWWDCAQLDELVSRLLRAGVEKQVRGGWPLLYALSARIFNYQSAKRAFRIGKHHYDIGNSLYERMLDPYMMYSCGYWREAQTLQAAQEAKLALVFSKLRLEPGMRLLDIGCGWGGAAKYAAEHFDVEVVGITVSEEQAALARERCAGLPVEIRLMDYRDLTEHFDRVYSIGMFEHVGPKNYRTYMEVVERCMDPTGLSLVHTIGGNRSVVRIDPWIERYIFPGAVLPSPSQITDAMEGLFVLEDWHCFGPDYDRTLCAWHANFEKAWPEIKDQYDDRFRRMWRFYLLSCAGGFRARKNQLWQVVLSPQGVDGAYRAPR